MAVSTISRTVYLGAESSTGSTVSSFDMNGTLHWGYALSTYWIFDMALAPDETYLAFIDFNNSHIYKMNLSTQVLTSYSTNIGALL